MLGEVEPAPLGALGGSAAALASGVVQGRSEVFPAVVVVRLVAAARRVEVVPAAVRSINRTAAASSKVQAASYKASFFRRCLYLRCPIGKASFQGFFLQDLLYQESVRKTARGCRKKSLSYWNRATCICKDRKPRREKGYPTLRAKKEALYAKNSDPRTGNVGIDSVAVGTAVSADRFKPNRKSGLRPDDSTRLP